jgi:hypothetical protein
MNTVHVQGKEVETKKEGEGREIIKWNWYFFIRCTELLTIFE